MTSAQAGLVLRHLRRLAGAERSGQSSDGQLLERFATERDDASFAGIVRRHGPMVFNVCRSILRHEQDAEDAFQATFVVLARKAASIRQRASVAGWLYEVAYRAAIKAQADAARRSACERKAPAMASADPLQDLTMRDLQRVLHEELRRLPDKYRVPLVLCYLEDKSHEEAARQLGWTKGTFRGRLDRGREQLRRRLERRGVALSAALCAVGLSLNAATAKAALMDSVVRASVLSSVDGTASGVVSAKASALAEGVSKTMIGNKMKIAAVLLVVGSALTASTGALTLTSGEHEPQEKTAVLSGVQAHKSQTPGKVQDRPKEETEPDAPALDPDDPLDLALLRWQKAMDKIETASCHLSRTYRSNLFGAAEIFEGTFRYMKPKRFVLELRRKDLPEVSEKWARNGTLFHQYFSKQKEVMEHDVKPDFLDRVVNGSCLGFLFGMKAEDAKRRYRLRILEGKENDPHYVYIAIEPRFGSDKTDFRQGRLVLNKDTNLPRQLWLGQPNGDEITWDIPKIETGVKLTRDDFKLTVPEGWRLKKLPRAEKDLEPKIQKDK